MANENPIDIVAQATAIKAQLLNSKAEYEVIAEAGVFKNGKVYKKGEKLVTDKFTGGNQERVNCLKFVKDVK